MIFLLNDPDSPVQKNPRTLLYPGNIHKIVGMITMHSMVCLP